MLKTLFGLLLLVVPLQLDTFKKEMAPLQSAVDSVVLATGSQVLQRSRATYLDGYGAVVSLEIAFDAPQSPFSGAKTPAQVRSAVSQHRKDIQDKMSAFMKQHVSTMDSIAPTDSLAIAIHVLNTNPADVPDLPVQILMTVKKQSPGQVLTREF